MESYRLALVLVALLAGCALRTGPVKYTVQSFASCTADTSFPFDRAYVAHDGESAVLRCGDGRVLRWNSSQEVVQDEGVRSLIEVARHAGVVPASTRCVGTRGDDCDLIDATADSRSSIIRDLAGIYWVVTADDPPRKIQDSYSGGVLLPRTGPAERVVLSKPLSKRTLETRSLKDYSVLSSFDLPRRAAFFQDTETDAGSVLFSRAYDLLIIGGQGAFIYFEGDVALLRAYSLDGHERWAVRRELPLPNEPGGLHAGFTAVSAKVIPLDDGRYAALAYSKDRTGFEVIDLATGRAVARASGWPIAASGASTRLLVRVSSEELQLIDLRTVLP
jgi:hypothetical protein